MTTDDLIAGLPGEALVRAGLADLALGRPTIAACLLDIARARLGGAGIIPPGAPPARPAAEHDLYSLLREEGGDAYSRYNALVRELVSFESALSHRLRRMAPASAQAPPAP